MLCWEGIRNTKCFITGSKNDWLYSTGKSVTGVHFDKYRQLWHRASTAGITDQFFLSNGFAISDISLGAKRWIGKGAYILSALQALCHLPAPIRLKSDECRMTHLSGVIVCNSRMYGGNFSLAPGASLDSPTFQVVTLPYCSPGKLWRLIVRSLLMGKLAPEIKVFETAGVEISGAAWVNISNISMIPS